MDPKSYLESENNFSFAEIKVTKDSNVADSIPRLSFVRENENSFTFLDTIGDMWYAYQNVLMNAISNPHFSKVQETLINYFEKDKQFPPDIVKSVRLYSLLEEIKPEIIIELGCGTSSAVINKFCHINNTKAITIDNSKDWLLATQRKMTNAEFKSKADHEFLEFSGSSSIEKIV